MKSPSRMILWILVGAVLAIVAPAGIDVRADDLGAPTGEGRRAELPPPDPGAIRSVISDDSDPFGNRLVFRPGYQDVQLWVASPATSTTRGAGAKAFVATIVMVVDPATGAVVGYEIGRPAVGRTFYVGDDGLLRIRLFAGASSRR